MFLTKFDELFEPLVSARVFTFEQTKHAKTVVGRGKDEGRGMNDEVAFVIVLARRGEHWQDRPCE